MTVFDKNPNTIYAKLKLKRIDEVKKIMKAIVEN